MTQTLIAMCDFSIEDAGAMWLQAPAAEFVG